MIGFRSACSGHRRALEAFLDRRELLPTTEAALAHVETCRACAAEAEETALTIAAIRRLADEASAAADELVHRTATQAESPAGWSALRARVDRAHVRRRRWQSQLAGIVLGASIAAAVAAPLSLVGGGAPLTEAGVDRPAVDDSVTRDVRAEDEWIKSVTRARKETRPATIIVDARSNPAIVAEGLGHFAGVGPAVPGWTAQ